MGGSTTGMDFTILKYSQPDAIKPLYNEVPQKFELKQNYPNPFNPTTKIDFQVPKSCNVNISIYDVLGKLIEILVNEKLSPGKFEVEWNASNFASGVYFYKIISDNFIETRKLILLK